MVSATTRTSIASGAGKRISGRDSEWLADDFWAQH
jgi:hypothetical protein